MKEGDYFSWRYKPEIIKQKTAEVSAGTLYWCCAKIAIFKNGKLRDIYWSGVSDGRWWTIEDADKYLDLTFLANIDDLEETQFPQYYDPKDIVDLRHANRMRGGLYIRKGAKRSKEQIIGLINHKIEDAKHKIKSANGDIERLNHILSYINTADLERIYI